MRRSATARAGGGSAAGSTPSSSSDPEAADETEPVKRPGESESAWMASSSPGRTPLKTVLQNFLNHVDSLEARKCEGEDTYDREFQQLKAFSDSLRNNPEFTSSEGELEVNRKKNRYKDILPFDESRVTLSEYPGKNYYEINVLLLSDT